MGKKWRWFSAVRKASTAPTKVSEKPETSRPSDLKSNGSKADNRQSTTEEQKWSFGRPVLSEPQFDLPGAPYPEKDSTQAGEKQNQHALAMAVVTTAAAEAAVAAAHAPGEVARSTRNNGQTSSWQKGRKAEELAAIKIQTTFRGYMARRKLRGLRGLVRLQVLVRGRTARCQASTALHSMQTLVRVQSRVRATRMQMAEENKAIQLEFLHRQDEIEAQDSEVSEINPQNGWDDSAGSLEDIHCRVQSKQEGARKRERALAYAFSQQLREAASKESVHLQNEVDRLHWGWNWMERWMATRPYEANILNKDAPDGLSIRSSVSTSTNIIDPAEKRVGSTVRLPSPSQSTVTSGAVHNFEPSPFLRKLTTISKPHRDPQQQQLSKIHATMINQPDHSATARSNKTFYNSAPKVEKASVANYVSNNESFKSLLSNPGYMAATQSAKAKVRLKGTPYITPSSSPTSSMRSLSKRMLFAFHDNIEGST